MLPVFTRALLCSAVATFSLGAIAAAPAPSAAPAPVAVTPASRSMDVLRAFDKLCNAPALTFDVLSERARLTGMKTVPAAAPAANSGMRLGRWGGTVPSGEFALLVDETRNIKGVLTSCAVAADVGDVEVFRGAAIKTMSLRANVKPDISTEGGRTFDFGIVRPPSTHIVIRDLKPKGLNRILITVSTLAPLPKK